MPNQNDKFWLGLSMVFIVTYFVYLRPLILV